MRPTAGRTFRDRAALAPADLATWPIALNTVAGATTLDLWPAAPRPGTTVEVTNTDEWLTAIAVGRAVGVSTSATPHLHRHPMIAYRPLTDAPGAPVPGLAPRRPDRPAVPALVRLTRDLPAGQ
ncbi:hypothetical protein [Kitasatospora sp. NPDC086791]|uniref:hypothetical protein n=1 Tax=Kitasatospora sp. NPDC086791 TaxID=3155178 RepID=UPI0034225199